MSEHLTQEDIDAYIAKTGSRAAEALSMLGKNADFSEAFRSKVGQALFSDAVEILHDLLQDIYNEKATDQQKAEFRAYKRIIERWTRRINAVDETIKTIKKSRQRNIL